MKARLEFNLDDQDDRSRHLHAIRAVEYIVALEEVANDVFRKRRKYADLTPTEQRLVEEMEQQFWTILKERDIELY